MREVLMLPLEELMAKRAGSVDPSKFPGEQFDLYSIPAFDKGCHEVVTGSEKTVQQSRLSSQMMSCCRKLCPIFDAHGLSAKTMGAG